MFGSKFYLFLITVLFFNNLYATDELVIAEYPEIYKNQLEQLSNSQAYKQYLKSNPQVNKDWDLTVKNLATYAGTFDQHLLMNNADIFLSFLDLYVNQYRNETAYILSYYNFLKSENKDCFDKNNIPEKFMILPLSLSAGNKNYRKSDKTVGIWQLRTVPSLHYGLRINRYVDERLDPQKSTDVACQMLKDFYAMYDNWDYSFFAFIYGPNAVNKAIKDDKNENESIINYFPAEDRFIYYSFLALQTIADDPAKFGYKPNKILNSEADELILCDTLHLGQVSDVMRLNMGMLQDKNSVYYKDIIPANENDCFKLTLPTGKADIFNELKDSILNYKDSTFFNIRPEEEIKEEKPEPLVPQGDYAAVSYRIKSGDNLGYIAEWFDTPISDIRIWNDISGNMIRAGQKLIIYVAENKKTYYAKVDKLSFKEKERREGKVFSNSAKAKEPVTEKLKKGEYTIYVVKKGDNPWSIAQKYKGVSDRDILRWNGINARDLKPGQKLKIKK